MNRKQNRTGVLDSILTILYSILWKNLQVILCKEENFANQNWRFCRRRQADEKAFQMPERAKCYDLLAAAVHQICCISMNPPNRIVNLPSPLTEKTPPRRAAFR
jgi:predicted nucleotidyltransferase